MSHSVSDRVATREFIAVVSDRVSIGEEFLVQLQISRSYLIIAESARVFVFLKLRERCSIAFRDRRSKDVTGARCPVPEIDFASVDILQPGVLSALCKVEKAPIDFRGFAGFKEFLNLQGTESAHEVHDLPRLGQTFGRKRKMEEFHQSTGGR